LNAPVRLEKKLVEHAFLEVRCKEGKEEEGEALLC